MQRAVVISLDEFEKVWSDEARQASLEARLRAHGIQADSHHILSQHAEQEGHTQGALSHMRAAVAHDDAADATQHALSNPDSKPAQDAADRAWKNSINRSESALSVYR